MGAGAIYLATLVATWSPRRGRGKTNLMLFAPHIASLNGWLHGKGAPWALVDLGVNVVLLVPFTLALARGFQLSRGPRAFARPTALLGCASSLLIELGQLFIPSRVTDVTDLILNIAGVLLTVKFMGSIAR